LPAFSNSQSYNEAVGAQRELGAYSFDQYVQALGRMGDSGRISNELRDQLIWYARDQIEKGFASPQDIGAIAQQVMPGLQDALQRRQGRLNSIADLNAARTPATQTLSTILQNNQGQAEDISRSEQMNRDDINDLSGRAFGREDAATNQIQNRIGTDYGRFADTIGSAYGGARETNSRTTGDVLNRVGNAYGDMREGNANTFRDLGRMSSGATSGLIASGDSAFRDIAGARDSTYNRTRGSLESTVGGLEGGNRETFGGLQGSLGSGYDTLDSATGETYGAAMGDVDRLGPASDVLVARVARNMAPAIADAKANLRRAGISPNDPQYASVMAELGAERSRLMDDAKADASFETVDRKNQLRTQQLSQQERNITGRQAGSERIQTALRTALDNLGLTRYSEGRDLNLAELSDRERQALNQQLMRQNLTLGDVERQIGLSTRAQENDTRLGENQVGRETDEVRGGADREIGLATDSANRNVDLGREGSAASRSEIIRNTGAVQGIDVGRTNAQLQNNDTAFSRTQDWRNSSNNTAMLQRAMEQEDYETAANLLREQNGEEITALELQNLAYDRGADWVMNNYARRDAGQANLGNVYAREQQNAIQTGNQAIDFGRQAQTSYGATQQTEAGQGNWGTRLIAGAAGAAAPFLSAIPVVGPALSTVVGAGAGIMGEQAMRQSSRGGGGGALGTHEDSTSGAYNFDWVMPQYQARQSQQLARQQQAPPLPAEAQPIRQPAQQPVAPPYVGPNPNPRTPPQFQGWW
jgi:hypothetical protein